MNFILHSAELHIGSSIRYENVLYGNYFLNCYIVKIISISFNCFSEYIYELSLHNSYIGLFFNVVYDYTAQLQIMYNVSTSSYLYIFATHFALIGQNVVFFASRENVT